jgi:hypothetical protein
MPIEKVVVFVHGWSVTNTDTYGGLPVRLREEAKAVGVNIQIKEIFLGRYISFHDEVRVNDISKAFHAAVKDQLSDIVDDGIRFVCITHSTGGPVIRDWWHHYYTAEGSEICPMSHLVMLAPANYGSALAQLGKGRLSRLKFWFGGVEPGQGVLDWLELGSAEAWDLNTKWICNGGSWIGPKGVFPFVLSGQYIDRAFYDHINPYTGEIGSDGVVRVAAANLCGTYIKLVQETPKLGLGGNGEFIANELTVESIISAPKTPLRVISGKSHSGEDMGIMRSVNEALGDKQSQATVEAILACIKVQTNDEYMQMCQQFTAETEAIQNSEKLEVEKRFFLTPRYFIHDKFSMMIFRVRDNEDHPVTDYDLILTDGPDADPNHLPEGFAVDRQRNALNPETITYFFNHDVMKGSETVTDEAGKEVREALKGAETLGIRIVARPDKGFVHYLPCEFTASREMLEKALHRNSTTLVDIRLQRVVRKNVFRVDKMTDPIQPIDFKETLPGDEIV